MRCSTCLIEMRRQKGGHVCPKCGASGSAVLDDGTEAEFEPARARSGGWVPGLMVLVLLTSGAAGAAWWFRDALPMDFLSLADRPATLAAPAPDRRMARREEFGPDLRDGVISVFGTDGEDRVLAFTALDSGELITVLSHPATDGSAGRASIVRVDGSAELGVRALAVPEGLTGASLAPAGVSGFYLALTEPGGVRLLSYGEGAVPAWERRVDRAAPPQKSALVLAGSGAVFLIGPAEADQRLGIAAYDPNGAQLWQRTFIAPEDGRVFAALTEAGGVFAAFETARVSEFTEVNALWFAAGGETLQAAAGLRIDGRLAGALPVDSGVLLLEQGAGVKLSRMSAAGTLLSERDVPAALLHDALALGRSEAGFAVSAAYPLADIQTDLSVTRFDASGTESSVASWRLPPHVAPLLASSVQEQTSLLAGTLGQGADADAFLLVLPRGAPEPSPEAVSAPEAREAVLPETSLAWSADPLNVQPAPDAAIAASAPAPVLEEPVPLVCRFTCRDGESVFPLTKTLPDGESPSDERLAVVHAEACRQLGADVEDAAPVCSN